MNKTGIEEDLNPVVKRLDVIIGLMLERDEKTTVTEKIEKLSRWDFGYKEIANILAKGESHVASKLTAIKKGGKKGKGADKDEG